MSDFSPACPDPKGFFRELSQRAAGSRLPLSGSADLTNRCNLRCVHCYIPGTARRGNERGDELSAEDWERLFDQLAEAGCLFLVLTGGEPLRRRDFPRLYRAAADRGFVVTLFTNATLVDERIVNLLRDRPPRLVDVTLYGATEETYERMTGVRGSYTRCLRGLDRLQAAGLRVHLKAVLTTVNAGEFEAMRAMAASRDCRFRVDPAVSCRIDGDRAPAALRLDPGEAAELEMRMGRVADQVLSMVEESARGPAPDRRFPCAAGTTSFHVTADGQLRACLTAAVPSVSLRGRSFAEAWRRLGRAIGRPPTRAMAQSPCRTCRLRSVCGFCPPLGALEGGTGAAGPSPYYCALGEARLTAARRRATSMREVDYA